MTWIAAEELDWQLAAACINVDTAIFYPGPDGPQYPAKLVCHHCDVRNECLEFALANHEKHGIWGGASERERERIRRERVASNKRFDVA